MAVTVGDFESILSFGVGDDGPVPSFTEKLTNGHWDGLELDLIPLTDIEILYPIIPESFNNIFVFQTDKKNWKAVQKSQSAWRHETITLNIRIVKAATMETFYQFLEDHAGTPVILNIPGVQPFMRADESNPVYITSFTEPIRDRAKRYTMSITFLRDPNQL